MTARTMTAIEVKKFLSQDGETAVGGVRGLCIQVTKGRARWVVRYKSPLTGRMTRAVIGAHNDTTLAKARTLAAEFQAKVAQGRDPHREKKYGTAPTLSPDCSVTFGRVAEAWHKERISCGYYDDVPATAKAVRGYLDRVILPGLGKLPIQSITPLDVFNCIKDIWTTTSSAREKVLNYIKCVFQYAEGRGLWKGDIYPTDKSRALGALLEPLKKKAGRKRNYPALAWEEMPAFVAEVQGLGTIASKALLFSFLTASRSKPVRCARWKDIDLKKGLWHCPESSMKVKGRGEFTAVLSSHAIALLKSLPRCGELVFPSPKSKAALTDAGLGKVITDLHKAAVAQGREGWIDRKQSRELGRPVKVCQHGTARATFKTWTRSAGNARRFVADAVEANLAHQLDQEYEGAYNRAEMIEERREVLEAWGAYILGKES